MNKKKLIIIISSAVVGIAIFVTLIFMVFKQVNQDSKERKEHEQTISDKYVEFKNKVGVFNETRNNFYNEVGRDLYPESVDEGYDRWVPVLDQYTEIVDQVEDSSNELKELCVGNYYSNADVESKCQAFIIAYEKVFNYYVKDITAFNNTMDKYREGSYGSKEVSNYELKYDYKDINSDGNFVGKN